MKLKKIRENWIGWDTIEIVQFNYDGKGAALCICENNLMQFFGEDLDYILFGDDNGPVYKIVKDKK